MKKSLILTFFQRPEGRVCLLGAENQRAGRVAFAREWRLAAGDAGERETPPIAGPRTRVFNLKWYFFTFAEIAINDVIFLMFMKYKLKIYRRLLCQPDVTCQTSWNHQTSEQTAL